MADRPTDQLPRDLAEAFAAPVATSDRPRRIDSIMQAVHAAPAPSRRLRLPPTRSRWRRGVLGPAGAIVVLFALGLWGTLTSFTNVLDRSATILARAEVLRDTVIERLVPVMRDSLTASGRLAAHSPVTSGPLRDTVFATLYDTMRIVRFALRAPDASMVSLVEVAASPNHGSRATGTLIAAARQAAGGIWELRTVVPRDAVARGYAFVIDDAQHVPVSVSPVSVSPASRSSRGVNGIRRPVSTPPSLPLSDSAL